MTKEEEANAEATEAVAEDETTKGIKSLKQKIMGFIKSSDKRYVKS